ncbi:MAG: DUF3494 domain-containing protein [Bacteroidia bacterium]|nr:DUF3494 domain-containing protein [Bacteroidia bacterium]
MSINTKMHISKIVSKLFFSLLIIALFFHSKLNFSQIPPLATTSEFAVFTSVGAINNSGTTHIEGDVGTNAGAFTGFPPGIIVGSTHIIDFASSQAAIDVDALYNYFSGVFCDTLIGSTLGESQVLIPNVYCISSASILNGDLILDAKGDPNAVFIFKIDGAFSSAILSKIILINLASSTNVYWQINGLCSLGDSSVFKGTTVANGAINALEASSVEGRLLSKAGAISLNNNKITLPTISYSLPIELLSFKTQCVNKETILKWNTISEINNAYFLIERSIDAIEWNVVGKINGSGSSTVGKEYVFKDKEIYRHIFYYRLKQVDFNESFKYSPIINSKNCIDNSQQLDIFPNPSTGMVNVLFSGEKEQIKNISIYNSLGEKIYNSGFFQSEINLSGKREGIYYIHYNLNSEIFTKKLAIKYLE